MTGDPFLDTVTTALVGVGAVVIAFTIAAQWLMAIASPSVDGPSE